MTNAAARAPAATSAPAAKPVIFADCVRERMNELLGLQSRSDRDLLDSVLAGLQPQVVDRLQRDGLRPAELQFIIPTRTLSHRKLRSETLDIAEGDRAVRAARIVAVAETAFGDHDKAYRWLRTAKRRFGGKTPLEMLVSEIGARQVEDLLIRIDEGYAA